MANWKDCGFATRAIHVGQDPEQTTGSVTPPIFQTSTYIQESPGKHKGYEYARTHNPTRENYERCVASLEGGDTAFAFASGLAAITTILETLPMNSQIVASDDLYGGTYRLFERVKKLSTGLRVTFVDMTDLNAVRAALTPETKMLWCETPTNPMMKIFDLEKIAELCKKMCVVSVCDNTFASPYIQRPIEHGFDVVMHSATKYLNGHSDVINGVLIVKDNYELSDRLRFLQNAMGAVPGPFDCFLIQRGLKTLAIRMEKHCANAMAVARFLEAHPKVSKVYYPGLESHPQHALAAKQMKLFGGMMSVVIKGELPAATTVLERVKLFALAESLGGVESLIEHPGIMTHASVPAERRAELGIDDGLIRLSVGIEDEADLIADLSYALDGV